MIKPVHLAALGALLLSVVAQMSGWKDWSVISTPVGAAGVLGAIGSTLVAMFSDKPRSADAATRSYDPKP